MNLELKIKAICQGYGYELNKEYRFSSTRKWRFDYAVPELMIAIEYEGIVSAKSRHTNIKGYTRDCEKYNQAQIMGWMVLRYTKLNEHEATRDLERIIIQLTAEDISEALAQQN